MWREFGRNVPVDYHRFGQRLRGEYLLNHASVDVDDNLGFGHEGLRAWETKGCSAVAGQSRNGLAIVARCPRGIQRGDAGLRP